MPLNPMGQSVNEQAYPFELIKNKTLQFLAKSLPILKTEYETIPKVARYLPANILLNPTSHQSTLGHGHFHELNQQVAAARSQRQPFSSDLQSSLYAPHYIGAPPFLRRSKRSSPPTLVASSNSISVNLANQGNNSSSSGKSSSGAKQSSATIVAEMMPNATLVVSSAHSSAGRIGGGHSLRSADGTLQRHFYPYAMITKDGYKPMGGVIRASTGDTAATLDQSAPKSPALIVSSPAPASAAAAGYDSAAAASRNIQAQRQRVVIDFNVNEDNDEGASQDNEAGAQRRPSSHAGPTSQLSAPTANGQVNRVSLGQVKHDDGDLVASESISLASRVSQRLTNGQQQASTTTTTTTTTSTSTTAKPIAMDRNHASSRLEGHGHGAANQHESNGDNGIAAAHLRPRSAGTGAGHQLGDSHMATVPGASLSAGNGQSSAPAQSQSSASQRSSNGAAAAALAVASPATNGQASGGQPKSSTGSTILSHQQQSQHHLKCSNVNGLLLYT